MQDTRIISVATSMRHCLALSAEGEVYSWGDGACGELGHPDGHAVAGPRRIATLERIESIAAGSEYTSAAVDDRGHLFTWDLAKIGCAPNGSLGYELDLGTECQLTPKKVDTLSGDRVVGVAFGNGVTLGVTDAGAVFSFGVSAYGALVHGSSSACEMLPRRIEALTETGRRFVALAAGDNHSLMLAKDGQVYGWGEGDANGSGLVERNTPQRLTAFAGERVVLVHAQRYFSAP